LKASVALACSSTLSAGHIDL